MTFCSRESCSIDIPNFNWHFSDSLHLILVDFFSLSMTRATYYPHEKSGQGSSPSLSLIPSIIHLNKRYMSRVRSFTITDMNLLCKMIQVIIRPTLKSSLKFLHGRQIICLKVISNPIVQTNLTNVTWTLRYVSQDLLK